DPRDIQRARTEALEVLKATDFRRTVLLEDYDPPADDAAASGGFRVATLTDYAPNRVAVAVDDGPAGYLVLTDVWYPGWQCTIDGQPSRVYRANYLFRGVPLTAGPHQFVFRFAPASYHQGRLISAVALAAVAGLSLLGVAARWLLS